MFFSYKSNPVSLIWSWVLFILAIYKLNATIRKLNSIYNKYKPYYCIVINRVFNLPILSIMKKNYFKLILIICFASTVYSQTTTKFFGVCTNGAPADQGIIYNIDTNGTNMNSLDSLSFNDEGRYPNFQRLVEANNGKIYGTTRNGGANDGGTLFEYNPTTGIKTIRHHFTSSTGESPKCSMIKASNAITLINKARSAR